MEQEEAAYLVRADRAASDMLTSELRAVFEQLEERDASQEDMLFDEMAIYTLLQEIKRAMHHYHARCFSMPDA